MTERRQQALKILKKYPRIRAAEFAKEFWPGHIMHMACSNQGNGACRGKKAWLQAGSFLGKLIRAGLVKSEGTASNSNNRYEFSLTPAGEKALGKSNA